MKLSEKLPIMVQQIIHTTGFSVRERIANKRYYLFRGHVAGEPCMLKIEGRNPGNSLHQRNHVLWTNSMQNAVPQDAPFSILPVLEDGYMGDTWHWFIMPYVKGHPFATIDHDGLSHLNVTSPELILSHIISLMQLIERTPAKTVNGIDARLNFQAKNKLTILETAIKWARNDTPYLAELLQIIDTNYKHLATRNSHGDFSEINLIITPDNEPVLLDAEISDAYNYAYYDAAEFYNRIFTRLCNPELAYTFLQMYTKKIPGRSRQRFYSNFLCISALRCIGNFMEISTLKEGPGKQKRSEYAQRYAYEIITYKIISASETTKELPSFSKV
jgi:hypothetical protein